MIKFDLKKDYEKKLVNEIIQDFESRRQQRKPLELQWRLNMNFYNGNQYAEISPLGDIEQYGKQYFWQEREVYNHIASIVETRISKLTRTNISISAKPMSNDDADLNSAKLSTKIARAVCEENKLPELLNTATSWSEVVGSCFFKVCWNGEKGRIIGETKDGKQIKEGDVEIVVVPPYELYPDNLNIEKIEDCHSIIHAKAYHIQEIEDIWGVKVQADNVSLFSYDNSQVGGGMGYQASIPNIMANPSGDYCLVIEKYERPTINYPNGRHIAIAGDKLLYNQELPYINGIDGQRTFPFCKIVCIEKIGSFFGTSIVERMIPLQRAYNAVKNRKHEFMNRISMGVLAVEDGSIDTDNLEEEGLSPGKILVYRQGSTPPRLLESGAVPHDFKTEEERILSEFVTISGVSELSKYTHTYSSMSGKAIALLVEQDESRLAIASSSIRLCVMRICEYVLRVYKQFCETIRLKRVCGENGDVQLAYFKSNELQSENLVFDTENEMTDSLAGRRSMVLELLNMGLLVDEDGKISNRNKLKILELLGFGNWETMRDISESHRNKAIKENLDINTTLPDLQDFDDHDIHIEEHTKAILSQNITPQNMQKLKEHIALHKQNKLAKNVMENEE